MSSMVIDAHEDRNIAIFYILGAYLHAGMPKGNVFVEVRGQV